ERATDSKDIEAESQLGYAVLRLKQMDIPYSLQQALTDKFGTPLDADTLLGSYYQRLEAIAFGAQLVVGNAQRTERLTQTHLQANGYQLFKNGKGYTATQQNPSASIRESWESQMLSLAFKSLKSNPVNASEEIQTATFASGKFRAIFHAPTDTLYVVDEHSHRGTIYQAQRGEPAQLNEFTCEEKQRFSQMSQSRQNLSTHSSVQERALKQKQTVLD
ncbi:MAG: hypothetical protein ACRDEA_09300, partial [Microcystaceae cyanobacterium]